MWQLSRAEHSSTFLNQYIIYWCELIVVLLCWYEDEPGFHLLDNLCRASLHPWLQGIFGLVASQPCSQPWKNDSTKSLYHYYDHEFGALRKIWAVITLLHLLHSCWILSLFTAIKGCLSEFGIFRRRALSSQPAPYQVLVIKCTKTT